MPTHERLHVAGDVTDLAPETIKRGLEGAAGGILGGKTEVALGESAAVAAGATPVVTAAPGVNEVQRIAITGSPTGGTFTITFEGQTTAAIAYNAAASAVKSALEALSNVDLVNVTGGALPGTAVDIEFRGICGRSDRTQLTTTNSFTGGSAPNTTITTPTPGVLPTITWTGGTTCDVTVFEGGAGDVPGAAGLVWKADSASPETITGLKASTHYVVVLRTVSGGLVGKGTPKGFTTTA